MRCARCGAALAVGAAFCGLCGTAVGPQQGRVETGGESAHAPSGLPVTSYAPSPYGPPVDTDHQMTPVTLMEADAETRRAIGYRPVELPPPLPSRQGGMRRLALACAVILLALLVSTVALAHSGAHITLGPFHLGGAPIAPPSATHATATTTCAVRAVDPATARLIAHPQLATGVRDATKKDYRPVNNITTFSSSQTVYLTLEIVTSQAGRVDVIFCVPGMQATGQLEIPAKSTGRYAEFSILPQSAAAGRASATILWNGAVAASLPFTITG